MEWLRWRVIEWSGEMSLRGLSISRRGENKARSK
jgi:hypothetical protein